LIGKSIKGGGRDIVTSLLNCIIGVLLVFSIIMILQLTRFENIDEDPGCSGDKEVME
jgi:hypothetical protein